MKLTKEQLIQKIEELYEQLCSVQYDNWYNRNTLTSWKDSYEYKYYSSLEAERSKLVQEIEEMFE